jgi:hypothetical protein
MALKMDPLDHAARWALQARREPTPLIDVSGRVTLALRSRRGRPAPAWPDRTLVWFATASALAASVAAVSAVGLYLKIADPLWTLFESVRMFAP